MNLRLESICQGKILYKNEFFIRVKTFFSHKYEETSQGADLCRKYEKPTKDHNKTLIPIAIAAAIPATHKSAVPIITSSILGCNSYLAEFLRFRNCSSDQTTCRKSNYSLENHGHAYLRLFRQLFANLIRFVNFFHLHWCRRSHFLTSYTNCLFCNRTSIRSLVGYLNPIQRMRQLVPA